MFRSLRLPSHRAADHERRKNDRDAREASAPRGDKPLIVAAVVVVPTFMEVLDTTIAVVALRYIAGGLSATVDDGEWVITSYLAANAMNPAHHRLADCASRAA